MDMPATPFPELNDVLSQLLSAIQSVLDEYFIGFYLQGSFAVGDFDQHSDCDFIVVLREKLTSWQVEALQEVHAHIYDLDSPWAQHLEGSYFPLDLLRDYTRRGKPLWYLDNGARQMIPSTHDNTIVVRLTLQQFGVTISGPPPHTLMDPIPVKAFRQEMLDHLQCWGTQILTHPEEINNHFYQCFVVFHFSRLLHNLHTGVPGSKRRAVEWASANLDPAWRELIDKAWDGRPLPEVSVRTQADPQDLQQTLAYVREVMRLAASLNFENGSTS